MGWQDDQVVGSWQKDEVVGAPKPVPAEKPASLSDIAMKAARIGFLGGASRVIPTINEWVEKSAYDVGGAVTDKAASMGASPAVAAGAGFAANVGLQAIPAIVGGVTGKAAAPVMEDTAKGLMMSALKPSIRDHLTGKADRAVQTLLDEGVNVSRGGVEALRSRASGINNAVEAAIAQSGATVDKGQVASRVLDTLSQVERTLPHMPNERQAVQAVYDNFVGSQLIPQNLPVARANEIKQGIYKFIKDSYGKEAGSSIEAQKALARGLKEEINAAVPGVEGMNRTASELWNALNVTERRALQQANNNPGGLAILTHDPASFMAFMADKSAAFKSIVARMLYSAPGAVPVAAGASIGGVNSIVSQQSPNRSAQR